MQSSVTSKGRIKMLALYVAVITFLRHRFPSRNDFYHMIKMGLSFRAVATLIRAAGGPRDTSQSPTPQMDEEFERRLEGMPRASSINSGASYPKYTPEYRHLQTLQTNTNPVDGVWWCIVCNHQNPLIHRVSPHPFSRLSCGRCNHFFNDGDVSTQVIGRHVMTGPYIVPVPAFDDHNLVPYGMVCPNCGLSHRAKEVRRHKFGASYAAIDFGGVVCHCGKRCTNEWYRFSVGPSHDWNGDHAQCYKRALKQRIRHRAS